MDALPEIQAATAAGWKALAEKRAKLHLTTLIPQRLFGYHRGFRYLVVADQGTVLTFVSRHKNVYMAVRSKCRPALERGVEVYRIDDTCLQIVSCPTPKTKTPLELEVIENLLPSAFADIA